MCRVLWGSIISGENHVRANLLPFCNFLHQNASVCALMMQLLMHSRKIISIK